MSENKRGGKREGAGRKSKSEEVKMIERLSPLEPKAFKALEKGVEEGDFKFVQMFYQLMYHLELLSFFSVTYKVSLLQL